jgi:hypothetical protein
MIITSGYTVPKAAVNVGDGSARTTSKQRMNNDALRTVIITVIDGEGAQVEKWTLMNPIITSAKFGDLDYTNEDLKTVEIGLKYDWAECDSRVADQQFKSGTPAVLPPTS